MFLSAYSRSFFTSYKYIYLFNLLCFVLIHFTLSNFIIDLPLCLEEGIELLTSERD